MPDEQLTILGQTNFRGSYRRFGIYQDDRRRHVYVIGKTGVGKTTFLENMVAQDIVNGNGVCLIDPHGDAVENLLDSVPPSRINDVVYFDPSDVDFPVAFNVLEAPDESYKYLVASGLVSSLKKIWADSWGPRLEYILRNTILALLDYPGSTILGILRMLSDKSYRKKVVDMIKDPVVKSFWIDEFAQYNERFRSEAVSPIQNKVGQLLSSAIIRNIMAQSKSTIDMSEIINEGKILLVNVSKGKIGEDNSALLGAMMINRLQLAAMDRARIPENERRDFYLYVDEFQNFATESFADILSEARKYRLNLTMAHQYIAQMEEEVRDAVFGNIGTLVSFRVGAADAELLEQEFSPVFLQTDIVNLDKYKAYIKLMINGISSRPFSMETLAPDVEKFNKGEIVRKVSRERYGRKREIIEEKIRRWSGIDKNETSAETEQPDKREPSRQSTNRLAREPSRSDNRSRPTPSSQPNSRPPQRDQRDQRDERRETHQPRRSPLPSNRPPRREQRDTKPLVPREAELEDIKLVTNSTEKITDLSALLTGTKPDSHTTKPIKRTDTQYEVVCSECNQQTTVPFKPDPTRPVLCKSCLLKQREQKSKAPAKPLPATPKPPTHKPTPPRVPVGHALITSPKPFAGPKPPPLRPDIGK